MNFLEDIMKPKTRKYFYKILIAGLITLAFFGVIDEASIEVLAGLGGAILGLVVADANVNKAVEKTEDDEPKHLAE